MRKKTQRTGNHRRQRSTVSFRRVLAEKLEDRHAIGSMLIAAPGGGVLQDFFPERGFAQVLDPLASEIAAGRSHRPTQRLAEPLHGLGQFDGPNRTGSTVRPTEDRPDHASTGESHFDGDGRSSSRYSTNVHAGFDNSLAALSDLWAVLNPLQEIDTGSDQVPVRSPYPLSSIGSASIPMMGGDHGHMASTAGTLITGSSGWGTLTTSAGASSDTSLWSGSSSWFAGAEGEAGDDADSPSLDVPQSDNPADSEPLGDPPASPTGGSSPGRTVSLGPDSTWTFSESGGTDTGRGTVEYDSDGAVLREGDSFLTSLAHQFEVPEEPFTLSFTYEISFDTTDPDFINDAFEAVLVAEGAVPLVYPFAGDRDAFFNLTEGTDPALGAEATWEAMPGGGRVTVDIEELFTGTQATVLFRLVNNDSDTQTMVRILSVDLTHGGETIVIADFAWTPESQDEGSPVQFLDQSFSDPEGIVAWDWEFGDGGSSHQQHPEYVFMDDGIYPVTLTVTHQDGTTGAISHDVTVLDLSPTAVFTWTPELQYEGSAIEFIDQSTSYPDEIAAWSWDFHGFGSSSEQHPSFTFLDDGTYTVTLTVTDDDGSIDVVQHTVTVLNAPPIILTASDLVGQEGERLEFTATFLDPGVLDTHTAMIDWGDGTSSQAEVVSSGGSGTIRASHVYADNLVGDRRYPILLRVTDNAGDFAEHYACATIDNVPPTLQAGYDFRAVATPEGQQLAIVIAGTFTDPGFDRPSAGTTETFTVSIDWGDGTVHVIDPAVVQGAEGVLTTGSFSAAHTYAQGGVYVATVTVIDDDGGQDSVSFTYGVARIDVKPAINPSAIGVIPVEIFSDPTFDATRIAPLSLRFGPGGAPADRGRLHGPTQPYSDVMAHFRTQLSAIQPTDTVAYLTGQLQDGTFFVGMDVILTVPPSSAKFFVVDAAVDSTFAYAPQGAGVGSFGLEATVTQPRGITSNAAGDTLWVIDGTTHRVSVQAADGRLQGSWYAAGLNQPEGIATDGQSIWIVDAGLDRVLYYPEAASLRHGEATAFSSFALAAANVSPSGVATDGQILWVVDDLADQVFVYDTSGTLLGQWQLDPANADASGITNDPNGGTDLWVVDRSTLLVYHYAAAANLREGSTLANATFALHPSNTSPEGIADPPVQTPAGDSLLDESAQAIFTTSDDFLAGTLFNVNTTEAVNELRLNPPDQISAFPYLCIPNQDGTVSRIDTQTGNELGRYRTSPPGVNAQPSRTTVDLEGNCYVANRYSGSVVKIGNTAWVDRNGNGVLDTSSDLNGDGIISGAELLPWGQDERVLYELVLIPGRAEAVYTPGTYTAGYTNDWTHPGLRSLAVDAQNRLWVGGLGSQRFYKIDGASGQILQTINVAPWGHRAYGALIDSNGILWSSGFDTNALLRINTNHTPVTSAHVSSVNMGHTVYGLALDNLGHLFINGWTSSRLSRLNVSTGTRDWTLSKSELYEGRGVAVTADNDVWAVSTRNHRVYRYDNNGNWKATITGFNSPTGVAVDSQGKVWVCNIGDEYIHRIDPATNRIDLSKRVVGSGGHYTYSDMTGRVVLSQTRTGNWTEIIDSKTSGQPWGAVDVQSVVPPDSTLRLKVRASDNRDAISTLPWTEVHSGQSLHSLRGRYLQVDLTLQSITPTSTPSVQSITVTAIPGPIITVHSPVDGSTLSAGNRLLISGQATAVTHVGDSPTPVPNRIVAVLVNGVGVEVLDAAGNFFTPVDVLPGENIFQVTAIDAYGQTAETAVTVFGSQDPGGYVDLLFDVSPSFEPLYARTSFDERIDLLFAELAIRNVGQYPADNPFYVGVRNISDPTVTVRETVGTTRDGTPYYNFSQVLPGDSLVPEGVTGFVNAVFHNPNRVQFTYDLVFLAKLNEPPVFTTVPIVETYGGRTYSYNADATDADQDSLTYSLITAPGNMSIDSASGQLSWLTTEEDLGVHDVVIRVEDGRGGGAEQRYLLSVTEVPPNRPPVITTLPVTEAKVSVRNSIDEAPVDLRRWQPIQYDFNTPTDPTLGQPDANWVISENGQSVVQMVNADAALLVSDFDLANTSIRGTFRTDDRVEDGPGYLDNDFMGFVFGYQDQGHYYLFDWRSEDEFYNGVSIQPFAKKGMSVKVIDTATPLTLPDLWASSLTQGPVRELFHNAVPWQRATEYAFELQFRPGAFTITVLKGEQKLESTTVYDNTYGSGKFGFYNFSQARVSYAGFTQQQVAEITYRYDVDATDPDFDPVGYSLVQAPEDMNINPATGLVTWAPTLEDMSFADIQASDATLPTVPGFAVATYATVIDPATLSFDPSGVLFVGRDAMGSGGGPLDAVKIHRIGSQGTPVSVFGNAAIVDPDAVFADPEGKFTGVPGAVIVGGQRSDHRGQIVVIAPDGVITPLYGPSTAWSNPGTFAADRASRLLFLDQDGPMANGLAQVVVIENGTTRVLFTLPRTALRMAIDRSNRIFTVDTNGTIRVHDGTGQLVNSAFATGLGNAASIAAGPGDAVWGSDIYAINGTSGSLLRFDSLGQSTVIGTGFQNALDLTFGLDGALYVSMFSQDRIVRISPPRETLGLAPNEHPVTIVASDGRGGAAQQTYVVQVMPDGGNRPPVIISEPVTTLAMPASGTAQYQYDVDAVDSDDDTLSYSLLSGPSGMTIDADTGLIQWIAPVPVRETRTFFGEDLNNSDDPSDSVDAPLRPATMPNATQAQQEFLARLVGVQTESFEEFIDGVVPQTLSFGEDTATLSGSPLIKRVLSDTYNGTFPTSGEIFLFQHGPSGSFQIAFNNPQAALGFYATDVGDGGAQLILTFQHADGTSSQLTVPSTVPAGTGSAFYFGILNAEHPFNRVTFTNTNSQADGFGFDDLTIGRVANVLPEPQSVTVQATDGRGGFDTQSFTVNVVAPGTGEIRGTKWLQEDNFTIVSSTFDSGLDGWTSALGRPDVSFSASGGNPGGYARFTQSGPAPAAFSAPQQFIGNWGISDNGGELSFDHRIFSLGDGVSHFYPYAVRIAGPGGSAEWQGPTPTSATQWDTVTVPINRGDWTVTQGHWEDLLANVQQVDIRVELVSNAFGSPDVAGLDNVTLSRVFPTPLPNWTVYLDENRNGRPDLGEPFTVTDENGNYAFTDLPPGEYVVAEEPEPGWTQTAPASKTYVVTLADGQIASGLDFGNTRITGENLPPEFTSDPPQTATMNELLRYNSVAVDPDNDPLTFDLPLAPAGMTVHPERGIVVWQPTRDQVGSHQVVLRVRDDHGGMDLQNFTITVAQPNSPPVITSTPPSLAVVDLPLWYQVRAQDADGDAIRFRLENEPASVEIDQDTGLLTWTATADQLGDHTFSVVASDGRGGEVSQAVAIQVVATAPNDPPVINSQPRLRARVGQVYGYLIEAHDPNGDPLSYHLAVFPTGMTVDATGVVQWQPASELLGTTQPVSIRVEDGRGGVATQEFQLDVVSQDSNQAPIITSTPPLTGIVGRTYQYQLAARDPEGDPVLWSLDTAPAGMSIDPLRGTIRWTPAADQTGSHPIVVRVQDIFSASGTQSFDLTIRAVNLPPSIQSTPPVVANPDELYAYAVRAVDPDSDPLSFRLAVSPEGMTIDQQTGLVRWTPSAAAVGQHTVRVVVEDGYGGIGSQSYTLNVGQQAFNRPPVITSTPPYYATSQRLYQYPVVAYDPEGGSVTYSLERNPDGMVIDASSGVLTWTPDGDSHAEHTVTVVATDDAGARATQTYLLTVRPNQPPQITPPPAQSIMAGASYRYDVRATDPEGDAITFILDAAPAGLTMDAQGRIAWRPSAADVRSHTVQVTGRDAYGATDTASYSLTVTADTEPPRVTLFASTNLVNQGMSVVFQVQAYDNVGVQSLALAVGGTAVALDTQGRATVQMNQPGLIDAVATAVDAAGNVGTSDIWQVRVFDPNDQQAPKVTIHSPAYQQLVTYQADVVITVTDDNLDYWRVEYAPVSKIDINNFGADDPDYRILVQGTAVVNQEKVATLDATLLANDAYVLRVVAYDINGQGWVEGMLFMVGGNAKLGNFSFTVTDVAVSLAGIPLQISRTYDTLQANSEGDFGYGWTLSIADANIRETVAPGPGQGLFSEAEPFISEKTRVYLTNPEGKRVGFTYYEELIQAGFFSAVYAPRFRPDPGVYDRLEAPGTITRGMFGWFDYNPDEYTLTTREGLKYHYLQYGGLQTITDTHGNVVTFTPSGVSHSAGGVIQFIRDPRGRIKQIIDTAGNSVYYQYDAARNLVGFTNQIGETTRYVYRDDPAHFLDEIYDSLGVRIFKAEFDDDGRLTGATDALGNVVQQEFDPGAFTGTITDARGNVTMLWYDERGNVTLEQSAPVVNPITGNSVTYTKTYEYADSRHPDKETKIVEYDGTMVQHQYDAAGNTIQTTRTSADGSESVSTGFAYDARNNLTKLTTPDGGTSTFGYTGSNVTSVTSALGDVARAAYDSQGRQTSFTDFSGNTTAYVHTAGCASCGAPALVTHPDGSYELRQTNQLSLVTRTDYYEADGTLVYVSTTDYDSLGRRIRETVGMAADQVVTTYVYQGSTENVTRQTVVHPTDPSQNRVTHYFYNAAGNLIRQVDPDLDPGDPQAGIFFRYDANGNRIWLMDPVGNVTTWIYDALDRVIEERDPLYWVGTDWWSMTDAEILELITTPTPVQSAPYDPSQITRYAYDGAGNLTEQIDRSGRRRTFDYDHQGNMLEEVWYDQTDDVTPIREMVFTYDTAGNMLTAVDPDADLAFTYDTMNRLETMTVDYPWAETFEPFTLSYEYDPMGNVISTTDNTFVAVKSQYDDRNRLASRWWEGDELDNIRADFAYTAVGQLAHIARWADKERTTSAGSTDYAYDLAGRPKQIVHKNALDEVLAGYDYEFDFSGLLTKETLTHINAEYSRTANYGYDQRGQLISALYDNDQEDEWYAYDANGNRTGSYLHGTGYRTGPGNQLLSDGTFDYTYDHEGNMVTKTRITPIDGEVNYTEYQYDFRNRMTRVTQYSRASSEGDIILHEETYRYDALGRRIRVVSDGRETISVYDGSSFMANEWARFDATGKACQHFMFTNNTDQLIAQSTKTEGIAWALTNHLGSIRDMIDNAGRVVQTIDYTAFGIPTFSLPLRNTHPYAFTGRPWDDMTGMSFHRARFCDLQTGRFSAQDPIGFGAEDANLFRYVGNSPLGFSDRTGYSSLAEYFGLVAKTEPVIVESEIQVLRVNGTARIRRADSGQWIHAAVGDVLKTGDVIRVERHAKVSLLIDSVTFSFTGWVQFTNVNLRTTYPLSRPFTIVTVGIRG